MGLGQHNKWKYQCIRSCASGSSGLVTTSTKFGHYWTYVPKCRNAANGETLHIEWFQCFTRIWLSQGRMGHPTASQVEEEGSVGRFRMGRDLSIQALRFLLEARFYSEPALNSEDPSCKTCHSGQVPGPLRALLSNRTFHNGGMFSPVQYGAAAQYAVQYDSHQPHMACECLRSGWCDQRTEL